MTLPRASGQQYAFEFQAVPSLDKVAFGLVEYGEMLKDWEPAFRDVAKLFWKHEKQLFGTEGRGRSSSPWPRWAKLGALSLTDRYKLYKQRVRPGRPILVFDGALRRAATGGQGSVEKIGKTSMLVGIRPNTEVARYAMAHATGVPSRNLPKRPPVRFDGNVRKPNTFGKAVQQIFQSHLVLARKTAFRRDPELTKRISFGDTPAKAKQQINSIMSRGWR